MDWKDFVTKTIELYRQEFEKLRPEEKKLILSDYFDDTLLKPCQVEVLVSSGEVACLVIHDTQLDDMRIEIRENSKSYGDSEFVKKYHLKLFPALGKTTFVPSLIEEEYVVFWTKHRFHPNRGRPVPDVIVQDMLSNIIVATRESVKKKQVDSIRKSAGDLKESIAKLPESEIRSTLEEQTKGIDRAVEDIKRLDKEISGVRQLIGVSREYQDWRLLVSDVQKLKGEYVPREVFEARANELNTRIDSIFEVKGAYDTILAQQTEFMKQQAEVMKQQSSFIKWIKYATILLPIAVISVPIIEIISIIVRHYLGIP